MATSLQKLGAFLSFAMISAHLAEAALRQTQTRVLAAWTNAYFGQAVSMCDTVAVVGAYYDSVISNYAGAAYIFEREDTNWVQRAILAANDPTNYYSFGKAVAIHGDTVVIGSPDADVGNLASAGRAYVFARDGTNWTQQAMLRASDAADGDYFGCSVGVFSTTIVVGAFNDDSSRGSVYVFERVGTVWTQRVKLIGAGSAAGDRVGSSVAIHDGVIVAGAPFDDLPGKVDAGSAHVFVRSGTNWVQQAFLTNLDSAASAGFGISVSVWDTQIVVGARSHDVAGKLDAGAAYVFERQGTNWMQQAMLTTPSPTNADWFGYGVSIYSNRVAVVAPGFDTPTNGSGAGFVFGRSGTNWVYQDILIAEYATNINYWLGLPSAISAWGNDILIGAQYDNTRGWQAGAAYFFSAMPNSDPVAANDDAETFEDIPVTINVLLNDTDADGDPLIITNYSLPAHGALLVGNSTNFEYTPAPDWNGTDTFTYVCADPSAGLATGIVTVVVTPVQDAPVALPDSAVIIGYAPVVLDVLSNDYDVDGDPLTVTNVTVPDRGTASVLPGGTQVQYTPAERYPGTHAFPYDITDGQGNSSRGSVMVSVSVLASNAQHYVSPAECTNGDQFGAAVALWGNRALIGARLHDALGTNNAGAVFVYERVGSAWQQTATIPNPAPWADDNFGQAVALYSNMALIGAPYDDEGTNFNCGCAYIFEWDGLQWSNQMRLLPPNAALGDLAGAAVALDGNCALVGAMYADNGPLVNAGSAYLWEFVDTNWLLRAILSATNVTTQFGRAVALHEDIAVVGHPYDDLFTTNHEAGSVYVYARDGVSWPLQANLTAYDAAQTDRFGWAVAVWSNVLAVSAPYDDVAGRTNAGSVYMFTRTGTNWYFGGKIVPSDATNEMYFGLAVSLRSNILLVGAQLDDVSGITNAGSVYVFGWTGAAWIQKAKLIAPDLQKDAYFGAAVAVERDTALIGASLHDVGSRTNQGAAYFFHLDMDEDGLGDVFEAEWGSHPQNPDTDDDTLSDMVEYIAGTDPLTFTPSADWFHATAARRSGDNTSAVMSWPSLTGRLYTVETTTNLFSPWQETEAVDLPGTGSLLSYSNAGSHAESFFRVKVRLAP